MRTMYTIIFVVPVAALTLAPVHAVAWGGNTPIVDCNDNDPAIHPGAMEVDGNGIDDDCDGLADNVNGMPSASSSDNDSDGVSIAAGDCNDTNPSVYVGHAEIVGDLIDNDCDGLADEGVDNTPSSDTSDHDGDGYTLANDRLFGDLFEAM